MYAKHLYGRVIGLVAVGMMVALQANTARALGLEEAVFDRHPTSKWCATISGFRDARARIKLLYIQETSRPADQQSTLRKNQLLAALGCVGGETETLRQAYTGASAKNREHILRVLSGAAKGNDAVAAGAVLSDLSTKANPKEKKLIEELKEEKPETRLLVPQVGK